MRSLAQLTKCSDTCTPTSNAANTRERRGSPVTEQGRRHKGRHSSRPSPAASSAYPAPCRSRARVARPARSPQSATPRRGRQGAELPAALRGAPAVDAVVAARAAAGGAEAAPGVEAVVTPTTTKLASRAVTFARAGSRPALSGSSRRRALRSGAGRFNRTYFNSFLTFSLSPENVKCSRSLKLFLLSTSLRRVSSTAPILSAGKLIASTS